MVYNITILDEAQIELEEAALFYKQTSTELSGDLLNKFYEALSKVIENPQSFQIIRKNYRKINLQRFPYKIIFRIKKEDVSIVAFSHQKRRPYYWRDR
jgi:hypothetical protein